MYSFTIELEDYNSIVEVNVIDAEVAMIVDYNSEDHDLLIFGDLSEKDQIAIYEDIQQHESIRQEEG